MVNAIYVNWDDFSGKKNGDAPGPPGDFVKRFWCPPASPIKGFGTERARLGTFKEISENCRFFPQKEKKPAQNMKFCMKN